MHSSRLKRADGAAGAQLSLHLHLSPADDLREEKGAKSRQQVRPAGNTNDARLCSAFSDGLATGSEVQEDEETG